ncbi:MAG: hypothetical protein LBU15_02625 [Rickettsiales bacterium]|jgi:hypothetical protein|nr:hypothetical protein [Rickettsiales bacterium]
MGDGRERREDGGSSIRKRIRQILMFECGSSFEDRENIAVSCAVASILVGGRLLHRPSSLFYKKGDPTSKRISDDARNRLSWEEARVISSDNFGVKFLFLSKKLGKNVVVKIPLFYTRHGRIDRVWSNKILYYISVWKKLPPTGLVPPELRNLEQVFDYSDIRGLPPGISAGYPANYPAEITNQSCGVGVTVSEHFNLGRSLGFMDRVAARSALLANDNIYGLIRALWAVQNPRQPSGINCPHLLIHGDIDPNNLVVVWDGDDPIVKICNWDRVVAVHLNPKKKDPFICKLSELPGDRDKDIFGEGGGIGAVISPYTAPEILRAGKEIDARKIDMFSLAMVLFEMLALKGPWYEDPWVQQNFEGGIPPFKLMIITGTDGADERWMNEFIIPNLKEAVEAGLNPAIARIIELCCNLDPKIRLAPEEISTKSVEDAKSALGKVVKASNDINGKGPGAPGGGSGGPAPGGGHGGN